MDISNKTLAIFLVGAIVLSLAGTLISLNRIDDLKGATGLATSRVGTVNLSIYSATDISLPNSTVDFGIGVVNSTTYAIDPKDCNFASLSNNASGWNNNSCWVNSTIFGVETSEVGPTNTKLILVNDGNVNVTITMDSALDNYTNVIGNCSTEDHNWYRYAVYWNGSGTAQTCSASNMQMAWTNVSSSTSMPVCSELNYDDAEDAIQIVFNLSICMSNNPIGYRDDNLTFTSAAS